MRMVMAVLLMALGVAGVRSTANVPDAGASAQADDRVMTLQVNGRANATPWVASRGSFVAVTWGATAAGKTDVYVVVSRDGGASFATPVRVTADGEARLGGEMPPRVALAPIALAAIGMGGSSTAVAGRGGSSAFANASADRRAVRVANRQTALLWSGRTATRRGGGWSDPPGLPDIVVAWGARTEAAAGEKPLTAIRMARSRDGGRTFQPATALQAAGVKGDRGWHALTIDDRGAAHVVWLDHRGMATRPPGEHDHHAPGADMSQLSSLYYARVDGAPSAAASPLDAVRPSEPRVALVRQQAAVDERELLKGVCYCCKTALETGADGRVYAAWRHVYPGNIRDIAFTMSRDGGRTFDQSGRVSRDEWQIAGCPDDGPAMAVGADGVVHLVWPTVIGGAEPAGALFYASTRDGKTFTPRQRVPTLGSPKPSHPQIALTPAGQPVIAWDEIVSGVRRAATVSARVDASGTATFGKPQTLTTDAASTYPMLVPTSTGMLAVWTSGPAATSAIAMRRLDSR